MIFEYLLCTANDQSKTLGVFLQQKLLGGNFFGLCAKLDLDAYQKNEKIKTQSWT